MQHIAESIFIVESNQITPEFEYLCITVLAHKAGDPGVQFDEKTRGGKSRETVPLKQSFAWPENV
jgi:hypothetical protein